MAVIALVIQIAAAISLLVAGMWKLAEPSAIREVISTLRIPRPAIAATLLSTTEIAVGLGLLLFPGSIAVALGLLSLAVAFAAAATLSLMRKLHLDCACFGSAIQAPLGWRQLALVPVWIGLSASVVLSPIGLSAQRLVIAFAVLWSVAAFTIAALLRPLLIEHRAQRRIIEGIE